MDFQHVRKLAIRALISIPFYSKVGTEGRECDRPGSPLRIQNVARFENIEEVRERIVRALRSGFASARLVVFDEEFVTDAGIYTNMSLSRTTAACK